MAASFLIFKGRILLGLFRNRNKRSGRYSLSSGTYFVFGINRILIYSIDSAPDTRVKGIRFAQNRKCVLLRKLSGLLKSEDSCSFRKVFSR